MAAHAAEPAPLPDLAIIESRSMYRIRPEGETEEVSKAEAKPASAAAALSLPCRWSAPSLPTAVGAPQAMWENDANDNASEETMTRAQVRERSATLRVAALRDQRSTDSSRLSPGHRHERLCSHW